MASVLAMYKNEFGSFEKPALSDPFPFALIRMHLEGNAHDVRAQIDDRNEKIGRKIRDNELKRIPYLLIVGEKEAAERSVSVRAQGEGDKGSMTLDQYCDYMNNLVNAEIEANKL